MGTVGTDMSPIQFENCCVIRWQGKRGIMDHVYMYIIVERERAIFGVVTLIWNLKIERTRNKYMESVDDYLLSKNLEVHAMFERKYIWEFMVLLTVNSSSIKQSRLLLTPSLASQRKVCNCLIRPIFATRPTLRISMLTKPSLKFYTT